MRGIWAVVPAAGRGKRFGGEVPKQYLAAAGQPLVAHALAALLAHPAIEGAMVAISENDSDWPGWTSFLGKPVLTCIGGVTRASSVSAALEALPVEVKADDFVLVHDAARPCVSRAEIDALVAAALPHPVGGLLAVPVADTLKRAATGGGSQVERTEPREGLWRALTPQMFRLGPLARSLAAAHGAQRKPTDEAQAMEWQGELPLLVAGDARNIKVTTPADLVLAEALLQARDGVGRST